MPTYTITISNTIAPLGPAAPDVWGTMVWGVDKWAYGSIDLAVKVGKFVSNSVSSTPTITLTSRFSKTLANSISLNGDLSSEKIYDTHRYSRLFTDQSNAESRPATAYSRYNSSAVSSYASISDPSTTWGSA